jgi:plastocyanin
MNQKWLRQCVRWAVAATLTLMPWSSGVAAQGLAAPADFYTVHVGASGFTFSPDPQTVAAGDTVHWVWDSFDHSTTSGNCDAITCTRDLRWDSGITNTGATFDFTFTTPGTYNYYCSVHGLLFNMHGTIIVVPELPIAGLVANSSSPTPLGSATAFTATVSNGSHITYTWDFGDGQLGAGITTTHAYAAFGDYGVTVTATNSISIVVANTAVKVMRNLYLPMIAR